MDVGATIKKFRKQRLLKQSELAYLLNVTPQAVSSWERNRTQPNMETIEHMCQIFGCKKSDFLDNPQKNIDSDDVFEVTESGQYLIEVSSMELKVIQYFRLLPKRQKELFLGFLSLYKDKNDTT